MTYSNSQVRSVGRIANLFGDPWIVGMEADRIKRDQDLTDRDIAVILRSDYDRAVAESTIQSNRVMYGIFGDERIAGCRFSHHQAAAIEARVELDLNGTHDLSKDQAKAIRVRAFKILEAVKDAYGPEPTVLDVRRYLQKAPTENGGRGAHPRGSDGTAESDSVQNGQRCSDAPPAGDVSAAPVTTEEIEEQAGQDSERGAPGTTPATKTPPARPDAKQKGGTTDQHGGPKLVKQLEREMARASGRQRKKLIVSLVDLLRSALATMDPDYTAEIVDQIRALAPATAAACNRADAAA